MFRVRHTPHHHALPPRVLHAPITSHLRAPASTRNPPDKTLTTHTERVDHIRLNCHLPRVSKDCIVGSDKNRTYSAYIGYFSWGLDHQDQRSRFRGESSNSSQLCLRSESFRVIHTSLTWRRLVQWKEKTITQAAV
ncbi:hypothetical protein POM88_036311 [Heracleum sosnowskyi]|uniref:Uncharacterized protein n=1 Tax=Heracleum sosnowskyi TaxID=360622 RepID=A0AAD8MEX4_9APIA|nr:hypothetical protein POM88_036311 [Heracleum sosnowskyi]